MDITTTNVSDLVGVWSGSALLVGFGDALLSRLIARERIFASSGHDPMDLIRALPWIMWLFAALMGMIMVPASMAYSGPVSSAVRDVWRFDKYFAALIALAFGLVFALDTLRFRELRRKAATWFCLTLYLATTLFLVAWVLKDGQ